jgi:hypothetical protein
MTHVKGQSGRLFVASLGGIASLLTASCLGGFVASLGGIASLLTASCLGGFVASLGWPGCNSPE